MWTSESPAIGQPSGPSWVEQLVGHPQVEQPAERAGVEQLVEQLAEPPTAHPVEPPPAEQVLQPVIEQRRADHRATPRQAARGTRGAVEVAELQRAWRAVQAGQFRSSARRTPIDATRWTPPEPVVPVLGCAGSAGASTLALALATVAAARWGGSRVVECCTATASGLAAASTAELGRHPAGWVQGRRGEVLIDRSSELLADVHQVPLPVEAPASVAISILDVGWELGQVLAADGWVADQLTRTAALVVVTTATVPGLRRLEPTLALLGRRDVVVAVRGPARWPRSVRAGMGSWARAVDRDDRMVAIPEDRFLAQRGLDSSTVPTPVRGAAEHVMACLEDSGLVVAPGVGSVTEREGPWR